MSKKLSIAQARNNFASILHYLETAKNVVEVTRRGKPVAVIMSVDQYDRLQSKSGFWAAYQNFRKAVDLERLQIDPEEVFSNLREHSPGRTVDL